MLVMLREPGRQPVIDCHRVVIMRAVPDACTHAAQCGISVQILANIGGRQCFAAVLTHFSPL